MVVCWIRLILRFIMMDYVPDIAAFKVLNFKGAESYLCMVRATACVPLRPAEPHAVLYGDTYRNSFRIALATSVLCGQA